MTRQTRIGVLRISPKKLFLAKFLFFITAFFTIFYKFMGFFNFSLVGTAKILSSFLSLLRVQNSVSNRFVSFTSTTFEIIYECTALFPIFIFISAVFSYPSNFRKKLYGILIGTFAIYALNIIRLIILSFVGINYPLAFKFVHSFLWEGIFMIFVIILFLYWTRLEVKGWKMQFKK